MPRGQPAPEDPGAPRGNLAVRRGTDRRLGGGREAWHHSAFPAEAKPMSLRRCLLLALVASPLLLFGCKIETINYFPDKTAKVRFANLVVGAPNVTGFVDGTVLWPEVAFQGVTAYSTLEPVQHSFALLVAGNSAVSNSTNYTLNGTSNYTLFAYGTPGVPSTAILLEPTNSPGTNTFQTRVLNLAPNTASFDLYVIEPATSILNVSPNVTGLNYGSIGVFLSFGAGTYRIVATETGTKVPIFDAGPVNLPGDTRANLVAYSVGGANLITMALFETTGNATITPLRNLVSRVRAVNIANATGAVDVLANDTTLFRDIAEGKASIPAPVESKNYDFAATAVATPGAVLAKVTQTLAGATDTTLVLEGNPGAQSLVALTDNNTPSLSGAGRMRIVNADAAGSGATVDVLAGTTVLATGITPTTAPFYVEIANGTYTLTVRETANPTAVLATLPDYVSATGTVYSLYIAGTAAQTKLTLIQDR